METENQKLINEGLLEGKKSFEFLWDKIDKYIEWNKIYLVMKTLDWCWQMGDDRYGIPNVATIKKTARRLLHDAYEQEKGTVSSAGFCAGWDNGHLFLSFTIEEAHTCDI